MTYNTKLALRQSVLVFELLCAPVALYFSVRGTGGRERVATEVLP